MHVHTHASVFSGALMRGHAQAPMAAVQLLPQALRAPNHTAFEGTQLPRCQHMRLAKHTVAY